MSFQVAGLASGIDTTGLIEALMFAERAAVRRFESSKADEQKALKAWTDIESKLGTLNSAVTAIRTGGALDATSAASSDESVLRVSTSGSAVAGTYAFRVNTLAAAQQVTSAGLTSGTALVGAGTATVSGGFATIGTEVTSHTLNDGTYGVTVLSVDTLASEATISFDGVEQTVSTGGPMTLTAADGGTLTITELPGDAIGTGSASITVIQADATTTVNNVAASLNAAGGPVRAQVIDTGDGTSSSYRLVITSRDTGVANAADIDLSGLSLFSGGLTTLRAASDATLTLGDGGLTVTRASNNIGDLFDGLSIDLVGASPDQDVEITVAADVDSRVDAVTDVVDAVTDILSQLSSYSTYNVDSGVGGPLVGSFAARNISSEITSSMGTLVSSSSFVLLSQIGVSLRTDGTYVVDDVKLRDSIAADPAGVERVLIGDPAITDDGVLDVVSATIDRLLAETGRVETAQASAEDTITELDRLIALQEVRLENVEDRYRRQFAALESLIGQLQSQSGFLSGLLGQGQQ